MTTPTTAWPWPHDTALTRARRVALSYRAALRLNNRALCDQVDTALVERGESWVLEAEVTVEPDGMDAITTNEAAKLVHVPPHEVRRWATLKDPRNPGRMLLPRFRRKGKEMTYLVRDVHDAARFMRGPVGLPPQG